MNTKEILQGIKNWTTSKLGGKVDKTTTVNGHALSGNVTVSKSDVGLGNVTNDAQVKRTEMGSASGVATLDSAGKVPSSQLPSYVDDVLEYDTKSAFPTTGETGKIYVDKTTNKTWRWGGTDYVEISQSLALGETSSTAYAGDKGKALADKLATIETGAEANVQSDWNATGGDAFIKNKPTNVSAFTNDAGYLTENQILADYYDKDETDEKLDGKVSNPIELTSLSADYTFKKGDTITVGTGLYKCTAETTTLPPFNFVFDTNGSVVIDTINGYEAIVVDSDTLNTGWDKVMDVSDRHYTEMRVTHVDSKKADKATTASGYGIVDVYTKNQIDALTRHTRLTDFDLNTLKKAVAEQNLEKYGLKVGDQKTINGHTYVIADLNPMKGTNSYRVDTNHVGLIVIPHTTQVWNASGNTSTGADGRGAGYMNSDLHYYLVNTLLPLVETDLGAVNLIGHSKLLSNGVDANAVNKSGGTSVGASNSWTWSAGCKICALSEVQVYGAAICSSSLFDTGEACRQLEVFQKYSHTEIFKGEYPWLRDIVSVSRAAYALHNGHAYSDAVNYANYVAALILFN